MPISTRAQIRKSRQFLFVGAPSMTKFLGLRETQKAKMRKNKAIMIFAEKIGIRSNKFILLPCASGFLELFYPSV